MSTAEEKALRVRRKEEQVREERQRENAARANKIARLKVLRLATKPATGESSG